MNSSKSTNSPEIKTVRYSCGRVKLPPPRQLPLTLFSYHHSLLHRNRHPTSLHLALQYILLTRNADSSRSCSVIWSSPRTSPPSSTLKSTATGIVKLLRESPING